MQVVIKRLMVVLQDLRQRNETLKSITFVG
jgi:hypothetical protein